MQIDELLQQEKYQEVVEVATEGLAKEGELEANLLFQRSYAYIQLDQSEEAETDLEQTIEIDNSLSEAHYNLAVLYANKGDLTKARESIERASQLNPKDENIKSLYDQLMEQSP
jgi:rhomboid protease GluP